MGFNRSDEVINLHIIIEDPREEKSIYMFLLNILAKRREIQKFKNVATVMRAFHERVDCFDILFWNVYHQYLFCHV